MGYYDCYASDRDYAMAMGNGDLDGDWDDELFNRAGDGPAGGDNGQANDTRGTDGSGTSGSTDAAD